MRMLAELLPKCVSNLSLSNPSDLQLHPIDLIHPHFFFFLRSQSVAFLQSINSFSSNPFNHQLIQSLNLFSITTIHGVFSMIFLRHMNPCRISWFLRKYFPIVRACFHTRFLASRCSRTDEGGCACIFLVPCLPFAWLHRCRVLVFLG